MAKQAVQNHRAGGFNSKEEQEVDVNKDDDSQDS